MRCLKFRVQGVGVEASGLWSFRPVGQDLGPVCGSRALNLYEYGLFLETGVVEGSKFRVEGQCLGSTKTEVRGLQRSLGFGV